MSDLEKIINEAFDNRNSINFGTVGPVRDAVNLTLDELELQLFSYINPLILKNL